MRTLTTTLPAFLAAVALAALPTASAAEPKLHECQHPLVTGVEVYDLHGVSIRRACPVALALHTWETADDHERALYGCHRTGADQPGEPFLRTRHFHGWKLSLAGPSKLFTMTVGGRYFRVAGTDFPINCT